MHVTDTGTGVPLVLLHAFPLDSRMWDGVRTRLAAHARLITPDQRGLGRSGLGGDSPGVDGVPAPDLAVAAQDVLALLDTLGVRRAVLGGCSMGGYVAMAVLRSAPERVAGLVLADTKANADTPEQRAPRLAMADRADAEGVRSWLADTMVPNLLGSTTRTRYPDLTDAVRAMVDEQPPSGVAWAQRAMAARPDSADLLRAADIPALVIVGDEDRVTPPDVVAATADLLPRGELVTIPACGHLSPIEAPDAFARAVLAWLPAVS